MSVRSSFEEDFSYNDDEIWVCCRCGALNAFFELYCSDCGNSRGACGL